MNQIKEVLATKGISQTGLANMLGRLLTGVICIPRTEAAADTCTIRNYENAEWVSLFIPDEIKK